MLCASLVHFLMAGICIFVMVWGAKLVQGTMGQTLADLPWLPVGWTYLPLPLGSFITLLFVVELLIWGPAHQRAVVVFDHEGSHSVEAN